MFVGNQLLTATKRKQTINAGNKLGSSTTRNRCANKILLKASYYMSSKQDIEINNNPTCIEVNITRHLT